MNRFWTVLLTGALALSSIHAEAARIGGGKSFGRQSGNVTQRQSSPPAATPNTPASPAQNASPAGRPATAPAAAAAPKRPWGAMLGGLAAGLGLAWLAHSLGMGAGFGNVLMIALFALLAFAAWRMFTASRSRPAAARQGGLAFGAAGAGSDGPTAPASAPAWERSGAAFDATPVQAAPERHGSSLSAAGAATGGSMIGSALGGSQSWGIPSGFDVDGFLGAAKRNFVTLQDAWDRADMDTLRSMMTDAMVDEIRTQLADRASHTGNTPNKTEVVALEANLLGIEELPDSYLASVEFSGTIREDASSGPNPFREVWNMSKPVRGAGGWVVAGVQALQ